LTAASENLLRQFLPQDAELWCKPEFVVAHGKSADTIVEIARQRESDLIVLGARRNREYPALRRICQLQRHTKRCRTPLARS
jgi:nucleotide-binding universal stress UspA family protein